MTGIAAALFAALSLASVTQPAAAAPEVQLSDDGADFAAALTSPLFSGLGSLVPMAGATDVFWVLNSSPDAAYLRLTLDEASWTSDEYAAALTLATSVPGTTGEPVDVDSPADCRILLDGVRLEPGESVPVSTAIALGDLGGATGQAATATMEIGVTLMQHAASGAACAAPGASVLIGPSPFMASAKLPGATGSPAADADRGSAIRPTPANTVNRFDRGALAGVVAATAVGAGVFFAVAIGRRRTSRSENFRNKKEARS